MSKLERYYSETYGEELSDEQKAAAKRVERIPAPLGLSEWKTTNGNVYYSSKSALAVQVGINKREASQ